MYLLDTNIWLERLLGQAKSEEVGQFLDDIPSNQLFITDFTFHSICVILSKLKCQDVLVTFVQDVFIDGAVALVSINPNETQSLVEAMDRYHLDFDDAYQLVAAERNDLVIVSFDNDFNRTPGGKRTPAEVLAMNKTDDGE